jgi:hypothetical protein
MSSSKQHQTAAPPRVTDRDVNNYFLNASLNELDSGGDDTAINDAQILEAMSRAQYREKTYTRIEQSIECILAARDDQRKPFKHHCNRVKASVYDAQGVQQCAPFSEQDLIARGLLPPNHRIIHPDVFVCRYGQVHVCNTLNGGGQTIQPTANRVIYLIPHRLHVVAGLATCCISARDRGCMLGASNTHRSAEKEGGSGNRQADRTQRMASRRAGQTKRRRVTDERKHSVNDDIYNTRGELKRSSMSKATIVSHIGGNSSTTEEALQHGDYGQAETQRMLIRGNMYQQSVSLGVTSASPSWLIDSRATTSTTPADEALATVDIVPARKQRTASTLNVSYKKQQAHVKKLLHTLLYSKVREAWDEAKRTVREAQCHKRMKQYVKGQVTGQRQLPTMVDLYTIYINEVNGYQIHRSAIYDYSVSARPVLEQDVCHVIITSWNNLRKTEWARENASKLHFNKHALGVLYQMQEVWRTEQEHFVLIPQVKLLKACLPPISELHRFKLRSRMVSAGQNMLRDGYAASLHQTALISLRIQLPSAGRRR